MRLFTAGNSTKITQHGFINITLDSFVFLNKTIFNIIFNCRNKSLLKKNQIIDI